MHTVPVQIKKRLRHWTIVLSVDLVVIEAAKLLANLGVEALVPGGGRFPGSRVGSSSGVSDPNLEKNYRQNEGTDLGGQRTAGRLASLEGLKRD